MKSSIQLLVFILTMMLAVGCKKGGTDDNNNNGNGGGNGGGNNGGGNAGSLSISGTSPEYPFWGDELTINGTGFSTTKTENYVWIDGSNPCSSNGSRDSTGWRKAEIISASATQLKIKVPYDILKLAQGDRPCGDDFGNVHVIVNGKTAVSGQIKMISIPTLGDFSNTSSPGAIRPGVDALLDAKVSPHLQAAGLTNKVRITAEGKTLSIEPFTGVGGFSYRFTLPPKDFVQMLCTPDPWYGEPGRLATFKIFIEGTDKFSTRDFFIYNLHRNYDANAAGNFTFSKAAGGNPQITVTGENMFFSKARFAALTQGIATATVDIANCSGCSQQIVGVPLSLLQANTSYFVSLEDACGRSKQVGAVTINP